MIELTKKVKEVAKEAGAHLVGIAPLERFVQAPQGHRPEDLLKNAKSVISMACAIPYGVIKTAPSHSYLTYGYDLLNQRMHEAAFAVTWFLEEEGYISLPIPAGATLSVEINEEGPEPFVYRMGVFSHRHAAAEAGLGEIGIHSALVTPQYGARVILVSVITSAELLSDPKLTEKVCDPERCGTKCVKGCPGKALPGDRTINQYRCMVSRLRRVGEPYDLNRFKEYAKAHPLLRNSKFPVALPTCVRCIISCPIGAL